MTFRGKAISPTRKVIIEVVNDVEEQDATGSTTLTPKVVATVKGYMSSTEYMSRNVTVGGGTTALASHKAFLPAGTPVDATCRLRARGEEYSVVDVMAPGSGGHHLEVFCWRFS